MNQNKFLILLVTAIQLACSWDAFCQLNNSREQLIAKTLLLRLKRAEPMQYKSAIFLFGEDLTEYEIYMFDSINGPNISDELRRQRLTHHLQNRYHDTTSVFFNAIINHKNEIIPKTFKGNIEKLISNSILYYSNDKKYLFMKIRFNKNQSITISFNPYPDENQFIIDIYGLDNRSVFRKIIPSDPNFEINLIDYPAPAEY